MVNKKFLQNTLSKARKGFTSLRQRRITTMNSRQKARQQRLESKLKLKETKIIERSKNQEERRKTAKGFLKEFNPFKFIQGNMRTVLFAVGGVLIVALVILPKVLNTKAATSAVKLIP